MDNIRLILVITLSFILLMMYQAWQIDYGTRSPRSVGSSTTVTSDSATTSPPESELPNTPKQHVGPATSALPVTTAQQWLPSESRISVETDLFKLKIDTKGGDVRQVELSDYPIEIKTPDRSFQLLNDELPNLFIAQSGLLPEQSAPTHQAVYQSDKQSYHLGEKEDSLEVKLVWQNDQGLQVSKIYQFQRGSYVITVKHVVNNNTNEPWQGQLYGQFQRTEVSSKGFVYTYTGGAISSPNKLYEKINFNDIQSANFNKENRSPWANGWAAMIQHYFTAAWIPPREQEYKYYTNFLTQGNRYVLGLYGPTQTVAPHSKHEFEMALYIGPKLQHILAQLAPGLDLTVDYGWLWFIAQPLFWALEYIYQVIGNWGWAIIILTILIKLAFFHLSATSYKSMANMRRLQPRLVAFKERYGDDREGLNRALMELYKKEKINPLGGCLPILVQIPVFISLYWVLLESVELRQANFIFWLHDLSSPDPYFVLPLIMGVTMLLQHFLNPAPIDPVQQKVMMMLPIVFTVFFAFFPSGLVLYWVVNNILSIAQQWVITKKIAGHV
jgi:YidC/Oxa1 family membrane protein insertase